MYVVLHCFFKCPTVGKPLGNFYEFRQYVGVTYRAYFWQSTD